MTPYEQAAAVYASEPCARTLDDDLILHARFGYIVSTPTAFALARPVWRYWTYERLADPQQVAPGGDCWWIWLLAGDAGEALKWLPQDRQWIGYERKNEPRFYRLRNFSVALAKVNQP